MWIIYGATTKACRGLCRQRLTSKSWDKTDDGRTATGSEASRYVVSRQFVSQNAFQLGTPTDPFVKEGMDSRPCPLIASNPTLSLAPADLQCMNPNAVLLIAVPAKLTIIQNDGVSRANAPPPSGQRGIKPDYLLPFNELPNHVFLHSRDGRKKRELYGWRFPDICHSGDGFCG